MSITIFPTGSTTYKVYECVGWTCVVGYVKGLSVGQKYKFTVSAELNTVYQVSK